MWANKILHMLVPRQLCPDRDCSNARFVTVLLAAALLVYL